MDKMLYVAMTGASQNARAQQAHANNLANISTTGFRRDFEQARLKPVVETLARLLEMVVRFMS